MQKGNTSVYGIFPNRASVEAAIEMLKDNGYRNEDISLLWSSPEAATKELAVENATKAPEGAAAGAGAGAILGGALGWLAGIGAIAIPGAGPFIAAGPIMAMLAGAGVVGAMGTLTGALVGLGIPEYEASRYEGQLKSGGILLSVHADDSTWASKAKEILEQCGATNIASKSEAASESAEMKRRANI